MYNRDLIHKVFCKDAFYTHMSESFFLSVFVKILTPISNSCLHLAEKHNTMNEKYIQLIQIVSYRYTNFELIYNSESYNARLNGALCPAVPTRKQLGDFRVITYHLRRAPCISIRQAVCKCTRLCVWFSFDQLVPLLHFVCSISF